MRHCCLDVVNHTHEVLQTVYNKQELFFFLYLTQGCLTKRV